ncbi:MAG: S9 family peptidase [Gemmatimonadetes bacterium]|nr:S9 family peptidase [Gemmatimonadota bacterium]
MDRFSLLNARPSALLLVVVSACSPAVSGPSPAAAPPPSPTAVAAPSGLAAAPGEGFDLSVRNIMRGELLVGRSPSEVRWSEDSRHLYFRWRDPESRDTTTSIYRVPAAGGTPELLPDSVAVRTAPALRGSWSRDRTRRAFERDGDIFVASTDGTEWRVTDTPAREHSPHLSRDGRTVYFLAQSPGSGASPVQNVYAVELGGSTLRQLTDFRTEDAPREEQEEGPRRFLEEQQAELIAAMRDRVRERDHREAVDSTRRRVRPVYLGQGTSLASAEVSPSGRHLLLAVSDRSEPTRTLVPNYVTESGYTDNLTARPKVGDAVTGQRAAMLDLQTHTLTWLQPEPRDRSRTLLPVGWAPESDRALLLATPMDFKDRWIYVAGPNGQVRVVDHLRDEAWIGGPAVFTAGWVPGGPNGAADERIYFVSERTGYAHLYTVAPTGGRATALTSGAWEVTDVQLSADGSTFYLTTSEEHPGVRHLYALPVTGGGRTRITQAHGWNETLVSPDGRHVAVLHAVPDHPAELYLAPLGVGATPERITVSTTDEWRRGPWIRPEIVVFPARDGARVHARIYRPRELGAEANGAAVVFVHGAGYLQNVHYGWSSYYREYMFHHLLASLGYTVLDIDFRASAGYGRDWRTAIYRHMGGKDLTDQVDGVRYLVEREGVDPARVGLYGGSYGGFITLMALFTEPDVFRSGAALRSVTDWAHYNHPYTARILNQPQDDTAAYRRSSPIYFAEGLRGDLLITHGMVDTNVHFQDVVRLAQRLIELGKTNWELAVYPVEDHAFQRPDSWADQYRRILELFERTIGAEALPAGR